jgi:endonuclease/exonuclease/phosphatase family metal-dependent hydrolase
LPAAADARHRLAAALVCLALLAAPHAAAQERGLRLATWNLEWLIAPEAFERLAVSCRDQPSPGEVRWIPCDIAAPGERSARRTAADFAKLREYALRLDADVVALQEVDGPQAARLVFPDHDFCFTRRVHVQNVGFAIRPGVPFRCADYPDLGLEASRLRWGADLTLFPGSQREVRVLAVHLKSGCHGERLTSERYDCQTLAEQVPVLERWIDARAREGVPFAVAGDFNRRFSSERGQARDRAGRLTAMWPELDDGSPPEADLTDATRVRRDARCFPQDSHTAAIDHIVLSRSLTARLVPGSMRRVTYSTADARRFRLSDHCPVAVTLELP